MTPLERLKAQLETANRNGLATVAVWRADLAAVLDLGASALYAMRCGCFHPVPEPPAGASVETLTQWGAMRNLHDKVAALSRPEAPRE